MNNKIEILKKKTEHGRNLLWADRLKQKATGVALHMSLEDKMKGVSNTMMGLAPSVSITRPRPQSSGCKVLSKNVCQEDGSSLVKKDSTMQIAFA